LNPVSKKSTGVLILALLVCSLLITSLLITPLVNESEAAKPPKEPKEPKPPKDPKDPKPPKDSSDTTQGSPTSSSSNKSRPPPQILGVGLYHIEQSNSENSYSNMIVYGKDKQHIGFEDYFPYSKYSDNTDQKNYGVSKYDKRGYYIPFSRNVNPDPLFIVPNEVLQIQVQLKEQFASTKIEHLSLYIGNGNDKLESYPIELVFDKGQKLQVLDSKKIIKNVTVNSFLEGGVYWVNFDIVFQKEIGQSNIFLQTWNEQKKSAYALFENSLYVSKNILSQDNTVSLTAIIDITDGASSPICKIDNTCFSPNNVSILKNGIITWVNHDSLIHDIAGGAPSNPNNIFYLTLQSNESVQKIFGYSGIYPYFCSLHPWMEGSITVVESPQAQVKEYDSTILPLVVAHHGSNGYVIIKPDQKIITSKKDLEVIISGKIQEKDPHNVTVIIIRPDGTNAQSDVLTTKRGSYLFPSLLNTKWLDGEYTVIVNFKSMEKGRIVFSLFSKLI